MKAIYIRFADRRRVRRAIYDYAREGDFDTSFCKRSPAHEKACRAAKACVATAGPVYAANKLAGTSDRTAALEAAGACVGAMLTVYYVA